MEVVSRAFQFAPQLTVVIDLAVKHQDGVPVLTLHRLLTVIEVDDPQADSPQRHVRRFPDTLLIRAAMCQRPSHFPNSGRLRRVSRVCEPSYSAQMNES